MEPTEGTLILFPGWLEHGVYPSESDEDRIVISANINFWPVSEKNNKGIIHSANLYT